MNRRSPGGPFPEGWEYFKAAYQTGLFIDELQGPASANGLRMYRALRLLPCKVPLDKRFDYRRIHLQQVREMVLSDDGGERGDNASASTTTTPRSLRKAERDRSSSARYLERWGLDELTKKVAELAPNARLAAVINLCQTERYYDGQDYRRRGIEYIWCKISGGGSVPRLEDIDRFLDIWCWLLESVGRVYEAHDAEDALARVPDDVPVIAMHCTHGVNRTGFFFATLALLYRPQLVAEEAMEFFMRTRGHQINREELREALRDLNDPMESDVPEHIREQMQRLRKVLKGVPLVVGK